MRISLITLPTYRPILRTFGEHLLLLISRVRGSRFRSIVGNVVQAGGKRPAGLNDELSVKNGIRSYVNN